MEKKAWINSGQTTWGFSSVYRMGEICDATDIHAFVALLDISRGHSGPNFNGKGNLRETCARTSALHAFLGTGAKNEIRFAESPAGHRLVASSRYLERREYAMTTSIVFIERGRSLSWKHVAQPMGLST